MKTGSRPTNNWRRLLMASMPLIAGVLSGATLPPSAAEPVQPQLRADIIINAPIIVHPRDRLPQQRVRVQFVALGDDWGAVYLDNRLLYRPGNFDRRQEFWLEPGSYRLEITGITRFEVWDSGYLDVGRDDAHVLVVTFSKQAGVVRVAGDAAAWIPDQ
ncbi:hypothetical protein XM38_047280 [Halomicronema hongdechloris C2206]|uniref:DUF2846 domain-containing protein n=1 Tax=Halomicronema hongdechloris C2206 TaxID=1641165 RepID=A0A1Z3HU08_9CYAN|nr:hypothetical protein [Halomicronema hongdechloris]ASC73756.1 hypothetical protein XM38_047280 [Halomicronema hongdechloris C2206]